MKGQAEQVRDVPGQMTETDAVKRAEHQESLASISMQGQAAYVQADPQESPGCSQMRDQADQTRAEPLHSPADFSINSEPELALQSTTIPVGCKSV